MIAFADPTIAFPGPIEVAEDALGIWLSRPGREVRIERPDGLTYHATAYERDRHGRRVPVLSAAGDTQCLALEELALRGVSDGVW